MMITSYSDEDSLNNSFAYDLEEFQDEITDDGDDDDDEYNDDDSHDSEDDDDGDEDLDLDVHALLAKAKRRVSQTSQRAFEIMVNDGVIADDGGDTKGDGGSPNHGSENLFFHHSPSFISSSAFEFGDYEDYVETELSRRRNFGCLVFLGGFGFLVGIVALWFRWI